MESSTTRDPRIGTILLERLKVLRRVGGGGMGSVYEVEHLRTGHHRALKIISSEYASHERFMTRLMREARVAARLRTPYVTETLDAGTLEDGSAYVLMELLQGRPLLDLVRERGKLEPTEVAWLAAQVCEGLAVAHGAGIVHRDLKPENIFVVPAEEGTVQIKILDFGISLFTSSMADKVDRLTRAGTILGTPFYMSPEQTAGSSIDLRSDIYSLGVVMYEALSGRLPYEAETMGELFLKMGTGECFPLRYHVPDIDPAFEKVVHRAFHRNADERFQTAGELQAAVIPFMKGELTRAGHITRRLAHLATVPASRQTVDFTAPRSNDTNIESPLGVADTSAPPPLATPISSPAVRRAPSDFPPAPLGLSDSHPATVRPAGPVPPPPALPAEAALLIAGSESSTAWATNVTPHSQRPPKDGDKPTPVETPRRGAQPVWIALGAMAVALVAGAIYWQLREATDPAPEATPLVLPEGVDPGAADRPIEPSPVASEGIAAAADPPARPPMGPRPPDDAADAPPSKVVNTSTASEPESSGTVNPSEPRSHRPRSKVVGLDPNPYR